MWWIFEFIRRFFFVIFRESTQIVDPRAEIQEKDLMIRKLENENLSYRETLINFQKDCEYYKKLFHNERKENMLLNSKLSAYAQKINLLEKKNMELKDEASKYQLALGNTTNFRFNDDDQNNIMRLKSDIDDLQNMIEDYVTSLKNGVEINFENVNKLLQRYGSQTKISPHTQDRRLIKAVLQHHVLKEILSYSDMCHENLCMGTYALESNIIRKADELIELIRRFSDERIGTDDVTRVASIKLRQQVYVMLGHRGYANVCEKKYKNKHLFLSMFQNDLNNSMNKLRVLTEPKKRSTVEGMAEKLIQEVIRIFKFRFKVQEPIIEIQWMNYGTKIIEECVEKHHENFKDALVDVCSFPLIGKNLSNHAKRKILALAKVVPIYTN
ncbi:4468_t:CDS:1 [Cetraspora pellucida]|uniref:4468_t:CDS:1 n=1 Tax=Cetraspora pellucida TaxID=1433469 RepID=A0A9N9H8L1_9GLOM|nr:4468_t:CDS:1 [Cetraspora pellucida]